MEACAEVFRKMWHIERIIGMAVTFETPYAPVLDVFQLYSTKETASGKQLFSWIRQGKESLERVCCISQFFFVHVYVCTSSVNRCSLFLLFQARDEFKATIIDNFHTSLLLHARRVLLLW